MATSEIVTSALEPEPEDDEPEPFDFVLCMDSICESEEFADKGRCRCSTQLVRIERVLRDIDRIQAEIDKETKDLEILMNVSNSFAVQDILDSAYASIGSIERRSRLLASRRLDQDALVAEGFPLQQHALEQCLPALDGVEHDEKDARQKDYLARIEADCATYTSVLTRKLDEVAGWLTQTKKNRELFFENQQRQFNQLEYGACLEEYQACAKFECGANFSSCIEAHRLYTMLQKCQAVNFGKCEDSKLQVVIDVKQYVAAELRKVALAHECRRNLGWLEDGRCVFKVAFRADRCSGGIFRPGCGSQDMKQFNPGTGARCSDQNGPFGSQTPGCEESCYLVGSDGTERYLGTNKDTSAGGKAKRTIFGVVTLGITHMAGANIGCQSPGFTVPTPAGWGSDGYPVNPELKEAMRGGGF